MRLTSGQGRGQRLVFQKAFRSTNTSLIPQGEGISHLFCILLFHPSSLFFPLIFSALLFSFTSQFISSDILSSSFYVLFSPLSPLLPSSLFFTSLLFSPVLLSSLHSHPLSTPVPSQTVFPASVGSRAGRECRASTVRFLHLHHITDNMCHRTDR